jgi:hypothetical protein
MTTNKPPGWSHRVSMRAITTLTSASDRRAFEYLALLENRPTSVVVEMLGFSQAIREALEHAE